MSFDLFIQKAWQDHGKDPQAVAESLSTAIVTDPSQVPALVQLATHVFGTHLGQWQKGIQFLESLCQSPLFSEESKPAVIRSIAILQLASSDENSLSSFPHSEQIQILASAAAALAGQGDIPNAQKYFARALSSAISLDPKSPANRALAVTGNNLAAALEEKVQLSQNEKQLMLLAAQTGRKYWEIAGTWLEVGRAEYRLAMSYLKSGNPEQATLHAEQALAIAAENNALPLEFFFGHEALAWAQKARGNMPAFEDARQRVSEYFQKLSPADQSWCKETRDKLG